MTFQRMIPCIVILTILATVVQCYSLEEYLEILKGRCTLLKYYQTKINLKWQNDIIIRKESIKIGFSSIFLSKYLVGFMIFESGVILRRHCKTLKNH